MSAKRPTTPLLALENVGKDYARVDARGGRVRLVWDLLRGRGAASAFTAFDNVSFRLERGQSLAIIGENGAGKSTLLKVVAGVIKPTRGTLVVNGRVGALLELGSGFHPDYTGLANIDLAAALLGLTPAEIADRRAQIIAFADIGEHIREPIKHYSSGMVVRLGFAVATALTPDILITDEVLAVGDESFQKKCIGWMERYLAGGGTLLFVSHSMYHVQKLCRHALWLERGRTRLYGDADHVAREYLAWHDARAEVAAKSAKAAPPASAYVVTDIALTIDGGGAEIDSARGFRVDVEVRSPDDREPVLAVGVVRADGTQVYGTTSEIDAATPRRLAPMRYAFSVRFSELSLLPGHYRLRAHAMDPEGLRLFDTHEIPFVIAGATRELGYVRLPHAWPRGEASLAVPAASTPVAETSPDSAPSPGVER
ncbi:MAG TPA: ABC transporter ATP-binding protein [Casimicrobiaceae bacterium]|nr:ABC transporter ATP-binding protein [Casimicrobiaceae bacterium]